LKSELPEYEGVLNIIPLVAVILLLYLLIVWQLHTSLF